MKASRNITTVINWILDNLCPPILRDCYPLMFPIYYAAYGKSAAKLLKYKDHYPTLSEEEYAAYYDCAAQTPLSSRPTDLNREGLHFILSHTAPGETCLDVGCGRGYLAKELTRAGCAVTGLDIDRPKDYSAGDGYTFTVGNVEQIPFPDSSFDTVTCAHVLEHVRDMERSISELLRVAKKRVLIVLPRQREYRYVADLHVRYFPYLYNVQLAIPIAGAQIQRVGSDWGVLIEKTPDQE